MSTRNRIEVLHGVNLDMLGKRDSRHYGTLTLIELEVRIRHWARALGLETSFFQTNSEAEYVERLHQAPELADGLILNPGAWTHYSYAIRDALELAGMPAIEVHLSDVDTREEWRRRVRDIRPRRRAGLGTGPGRLPRGARPAGRPARRRATLGRMSAYVARADRLAQRVEELGLDMLLVNHLVNVRYLTGFTGSNGAFLVGPGRRVFLTDFRYVERAKEEVPDFDRVRGREDMLESALEIALDAGMDREGPVRLGFDDAHMTVRAHAKLAELAGDRVELVRGGRAGGGPARRQGRGGGERHPSLHGDRGRPLPVADLRTRPGREDRARGCRRARATGPGPRGRRALLPPDRGRRRERRPAACHSPPRRRDPARHAGRGRPRLRARLLLLGLHADVRHRRDRRGGPRRLRAGAHRPGGGAGGHAAGRGRAGGGPGGARRDRGGRARRPVRARARARRRPGGSRGAAARALRDRVPGGRQRGDRSSPACTCPSGSASASRTWSS